MALDEKPRPDPAAGLTPLALAARGGRDGAEDRLWEALRPRLTRAALALGAEPGEVPDLVQDVLLAGHRALRSFDPAKGTVEAWTAAILVRRVRNALRAGRRRLRFAARLFLLSPRPSRRGPVDAVEARLTLARLLTSLGEREREIVALYEISDLSAEETGRLLGISAAGVRSIARDARLRLARAAEAERVRPEERS